MRWLFAFLCPPLSVLLCGKPVQAVVSGCFWLLSLVLLFFGIGFILWAILTFHAIILCRIAHDDKRLDKIVKAMERTNAPAAAAPVVADQ